MRKLKENLMAGILLSATAIITKQQKGRAKASLYSGNGMVTWWIVMYCIVDSINME